VIKYLVIGRDKSYFVKHHSDSTKKFSETNIFKMLEFLIYNIFVIEKSNVLMLLQEERDLNCMYNNTVSSEALTTARMTPGGYNTAPADPVILIMVAYLLL
jgi:hypothetical protein